MITPFPFYNSSYYRYYPHYSYTRNSRIYKHKQDTVNSLQKKSESSKQNINQNKDEETKKIRQCEDRQSFEILGIKLYFDDILLICLIFFLYNEGIQDQYLFICLILLLLS